MEDIAAFPCFGSADMLGFSWNLSDYLERKISFEEFKRQREERNTKEKKSLGEKGKSLLTENPKDSEVSYQQEVTLPTPRTKTPTREKHRRTKSVHKIFAFR